MTGSKGTTQKEKLLRQCVSCREMKQKKELIRIVRSPQGEVLIDPGGRMNGRGAYVCRSMACLERARKTHAPDRSLKVRVPDAVYEMLEREIKT